MNKEIIGYKLIDDTKLTNVNYIVGLKMGTTSYGNASNNKIGGYCVKGNPDSIKALKNAGVLDIWFTPIYKEEPIPEYVECTNWAGITYKIGKIYKVSELTKHISPFTSHKHCFTPSTKEAYDLQNKPKFEVGKWYKIEAYKAYFKFKSITTAYGFDNVSYFDCIWNGGTLKSNNSICNTQATNSAVLLTDLSEIQPFLPDGHPDKIVKEFVLPKEWSVKVTQDNFSYLTSIRNMTTGAINGYLTNKHLPQLQYKWGGVWESVTYGKEITLEQFKKYVLKEVDWTKATKEELLAEAKRKYPVGTKYKVVHMPSCVKTVLSHDNFDLTFIYNGAATNLGINFLTKEQNNGKGGIVYLDGKWAEIVETPKEETKVEVKELFSKEQLEVINKMIDDKIKMLE